MVPEKGEGSFCYSSCASSTKERHYRFGCPPSDSIWDAFSSLLRPSGTLILGSKADSERIALVVAIRGIRRIRLGNFAPQLLIEGLLVRI